MNSIVNRFKTLLESDLRWFWTSLYLFMFVANILFKCGGLITFGEFLHIWTILYTGFAFFQPLFLQKRDEKGLLDHGSNEFSFLKIFLIFLGRRERSEALNHH